MTKINALSCLKGVEDKTMINNCIIKASELWYWIAKGWRILSFVTYRLKDGWTILHGTFRNGQGDLQEHPRERIFQKN